MKFLAVLALLVLASCMANSPDATATAAITGLPISEDNNAGAMTGTGMAIRTQTVEYQPGANGFLAEPEMAGNYPGIVLIHEWWGLNDQIKQAAQALASHGYRVLAVDLYNGKVATTSQEAQNYSRSIDKGEAVTNMRNAVQYLRAAGSPSIASYGWCFGGGQSLQLALNEPLDAAIIYYGQLETDPQKLKTMPPTLGIFGAEDKSIPVVQARAFNQSLGQAGVMHKIYVYEGVGHAFANPSGANYAPVQTADAWNKTLEFLAMTLSS